VLQFAGNLTDRQAASAVACRIDWKYALLRHGAVTPGQGGLLPDQDFLRVWTAGVGRWSTGSCTWRGVGCRADRGTAAKRL